MRLLLASSLASALLYGSGSFAAQSDLISKTVPVQIKAAPPTSCPIAVSADRLVRGQVYTVTGSDAATQSRQGLQIQMDARAGQRIASANLLVESYSLRGRVLTVDSNDHPDIARTFHLVSTSPTRSLASQVWIGHVGAIAWVDITMLRYADGTAWQAPAGIVCRVYPPGVVPVATSR